jgi:hypothetical protein
VVSLTNSLPKYDDNGGEADLGDVLAVVTGGAGAVDFGRRLGGGCRPVLSWMQTRHGSATGVSWRRVVCAAATGQRGEAFVQVATESYRDAAGPADPPLTFQVNGVGVVSPRLAGFDLAGIEAFLAVDPAQDKYVINARANGKTFHDIFAFD